MLLHSEHLGLQPMVAREYTDVQMTTVVTLLVQFCGLTEVLRSGLVCNTIVFIRSMSELPPYFKAHRSQAREAGAMEHEIYSILPLRLHTDVCICLQLGYSHSLHVPLVSLSAVVLRKYGST